MFPALFSSHITHLESTVMITKISAFFLLISLSLVAACSSSDSPDSGGTNSPHYEYVANNIIFPSTTAEANAFAFDLDGDGSPENNLGSLLATLGGFLDSLNIAEAVQSAIDSGSIIILFDLEADNLTETTNAELTVYTGENPSPAPCSSETSCGNHLTGNGSFDVVTANDAHKNTTLRGRITEKTFEGGPNRVTVQMTFDAQTTIPLRLVGAFARATIDENSVLSNGVLSGALSAQELQALLPAFATIINNYIAAECTDTSASDCGCGDSLSRTAALNIFDTNNDCTVTGEEFQGSSLLASVLAPDVDLFDADGNYAPTYGDDSEPDSISIGIGFSAVGASFDIPLN